MADPGGSKTISSGTVGCPCTDASIGILASLVERSCEISDSEGEGGRLFNDTDDGVQGVRLAADGPCVPHSYGAAVCRRHDLIHDPKCALADSGESGNPDYCLRSWCYVDAATCRRSPTGRMYRSNYFPYDLGVDLFYSYATCNSTADEWLNYEGQHVLGGKTISAIIPAYMPPTIFKRDSEGEALYTAGSEYYDSRVPFEGALIDYLESLESISNGDFTLNYTYGSEAGKASVPRNSPWTGAVQDMEDGLNDMVAGPLWITGDRLQKTSFTVPLLYDRTVLFIPKPGQNTIGVQMEKVLEPFTAGVWFSIFGIIMFTALISVWFSYGKKFSQDKNPARAKKRVYARLAVDEFLQKGMFFCSAGVEQDAGASLPQKLLMFGFGFFILILVSSYVANLAAFLTRPSDYVGTMQDVVDQGVKVCATPQFKTELEILWPNVKFIFPETGDPLLTIRDWKAGECDVIATGKYDVTHSVEYMKAFCNEDLVYTDSIVTENPIAFPIRPELAAGLSHWIYEGEKNHGITLERTEVEYAANNWVEPVCNLEFSPQEYESSELERINPQHLMLPFLFFLAFAAIAIVLQLYHQRTLSRGKERTMIGRADALSDSGGLNFRKQLRRSSSFRRLQSHVSSLSFHASVLHTEGPLHQDVDDPEDANATSATPPDVAQLEDNFIENDQSQAAALNKKPFRNKSVRFSEFGFSDRPVEEEDISKELGVVDNSISEDGSATSRLRMLVETGAFDEILNCVQEIKQQKDH